MRILDWFWRLMGYRKVWLEDFDGELNQRLAKPIQITNIRGAMIANRYAWFYPVMVVLLPDGTVKGRSYVVKWHEDANE